MKFGSALAEENKGERGGVHPSLRIRKESACGTRPRIIQSRMEEIMEHVHFGIKNSHGEAVDRPGCSSPAVAQLKHLSHLVGIPPGPHERPHRIPQRAPGQERKSVERGTSRCSPRAWAW